MKIFKCKQNFKKNLTKNRLGIKNCDKEDLAYFIMKNQRLVYCVDYNMFDEHNNHLMYLYKYLGFKHRSLNLLTSQDNYEMSRKIAKMLLMGICDSCVRYFLGEN